MNVCKERRGCCCRGERIVERKGGREGGRRSLRGGRREREIRRVVEREQVRRGVTCVRRVERCVKTRVVEEDDAENFGGLDWGKCRVVRRGGCSKKTNGWVISCDIGGG